MPQYHSLVCVNQIMLLTTLFLFNGKSLAEIALLAVEYCTHRLSLILYCYIN